MKPRSVPILTYHHVHPDGHPALQRASRKGLLGHMAASGFRSHLEFLIGTGWQIRSTSEIIDWLIDKSQIPEKTAAIHFDNGWLDTWKTARAVLDEFGAKALVYIIGGATEQGSVRSGVPQRWNLRTRTEGHVSSEDHRIMSWEQVHDLLDSGWEVGAHTLSHPRLTRVLAEQGPEEVRREIEESNQILRRRLGIEPIHFAYPSGDWNEGVEKIVAPYYRSVRLWRKGPPWHFTHQDTPPARIECQNIDTSVSTGQIQAFLEAAARGESVA